MPGEMSSVLSGEVNLKVGAEEAFDVEVLQL